MFDKLNTPEEIFSCKLGSALTMESDVLEMLDELRLQTQRDELRQLFERMPRRHASTFETSPGPSGCWARSPTTAHAR